MEKRVYLTKVVKITRHMAGEDIETQVPYLGHLPVDPKFGSEYHWDVIYDEDGDIDGKTPGKHTKCIVGIYCDLDDHKLLEKDPDMKRIDIQTKTNKNKTLKKVNSKYNVEIIDELKKARQYGNII